MSQPTLPEEQKIRSELYGRVENRDLRTFILHRGYNVDPTALTAITDRHELVRTLEALDKEMGFRFMDLPSEIRIQVYEALFFTPRGRRVGICRVSRKIQKEAEAVLYDLEILRIHVAFEQDAPPRTYSVGTTVGSFEYHHYTSMPVILEHCERMWHSMQKFRRVKITITVLERIYVDIFWPWNEAAKVLYIPLSILASGSKFRLDEVVMSMNSALGWQEPGTNSAPFFDLLAKFNDRVKITIMEWNGDSVGVMPLHRNDKVLPVQDLLRLKERIGRWSAADQKAASLKSTFSSLQQSLAKGGKEAFENNCRGMDGVFKSVLKELSNHVGQERLAVEGLWIRRDCACVSEVPGWTQPL